MIVVDTSALMAIVLREPAARRCMDRIDEEAEVLVSAGTAAEALIVAIRRGVRDEMARLLDEAGIEIVPVMAATASRIADAYGTWGKGINRAGLNYGDCFAYEVAKTRDCPLLFVGEDFAKTDVESAL